MRNFYNWTRKLRQNPRFPLAGGTVFDSAASTVGVSVSSRFVRYNNLNGVAVAIKQDEDKCVILYKQIYNFIYCKWW